MTDEFKIGDIVVAIGSTIKQTIIGETRELYKTKVDFPFPYDPCILKEDARKNYVKVGGNGDDYGLEKNHAHRNFVKIGTWRKKL